MGSLRIKICGITNVADALAAAALGADAIGLNFWAESPRRVEPTVAEQILRELPPFVDPVGLFVSAPLNQVFAAVERFGRIRTLQWHGDHPEPNPNPAYRFIPAFQVRERDCLARIDDYLARCRAQNQTPAAVLVDGHAAGAYGGTGRTAPWELLADYHPGVPLILAGGLTPDNVAEAVRIVRPYAVDVASGVESSPGRKDLEKMRRFVENARRAPG